MLVGCGGQGPGFKSPEGIFRTHIHLDYTRVEFLSCIYIYIKELSIFLSINFQMIKKYGKYLVVILHSNCLFS